jgi:hypothetical protein
MTDEGWSTRRDSSYDCVSSNLWVAFRGWYATIEVFVNSGRAMCNSLAVCSTPAFVGQGAGEGSELQLFL